jgi:hypothetical protein
VAQLLGALLLIGLAIFAVKVAILLLFLAGLIFRTKETAGLLAILGIVALFRNYPVACLVVLGVAGLVAIIRAAKRKGGEVPLPPPETIDS